MHHNKYEKYSETIITCNYISKENERKSTGEKKSKVRSVK
jgi:hypothetical protein